MNIFELSILIVLRIQEKAQSVVKDVLAKGALNTEYEILMMYVLQLVAWAWLCFLFGVLSFVFFSFLFFCSFVGIPEWSATARAVAFLFSWFSFDQLSAFFVFEYHT